MYRLAIRAAVLAAALAGASAWAETPVERGRYLVESIAGCGNCHSPRGPAGFIPGKQLAGGFVMDDYVMAKPL